MLEKDSLKALGQRVDAATHAYIGKRACGCVLAVVIEIPGEQKFTAKSVSEFIKDGYAVERVTVEESRKLLVARCPHTAVKKLVRA